VTTKILALTDALGNLVRFVLLPGHRFDTVGVAPLIDGLTFEGFIADKAFDSNSIIADLNERGAKIVISQHPRARFAPCRSTAKSTSGATSSKTSSASSRNSNASQCAQTKPISEVDPRSWDQGSPKSRCDSACLCPSNQAASCCCFCVGCGYVGNAFALSK
jgi:transposase